MIARPFGTAALALGAAAMWTALGAATPDFRHARAAGALTVYSDDRDPYLFYYPPGELALAHTASGAPDLLLLETRYATGTEEFHRNLLTFRVTLAGPTGEQLRAAVADLSAQTRAAARLRPLTIDRLEAVVVYVPLGGGAARPGAPDSATDSTGARLLPAGHFEGVEGENSLGSSDSYWTTRNFSIRMDDPTAQGYGSLLRSGTLSVSIGYAFVAKMIADDSSSPGELSGSPELVRALKAQLGMDSARAGSGAMRRVVRSGALPIEVDVQKWPGLIRQIDIDSRSPPGYAAIDAYCYDFRDSLRAALFAKRLEVAAAGASRAQPVTAAATFDMLHPDVHKTTIRFKYAVRVDRPYRYRVVEIADDGTETAGPWKQSSSWVEMLDITTPAAAPGGDDPPGAPPALTPENRP